MSGFELTPARRRQRVEAATTHGARSPSRIKARARAHRRRFLRQIGLAARDLDAIAIAYLDGWARALAKIDAYDDYGMERDPREYHAALNSARLWMAKLEGRLTVVGLDRGQSRGDPLAQLRARGAAALERHDDERRDDA